MRAQLNTALAVLVALGGAASIHGVVQAQAGGPGGPGQNINVVTGSADQFTGDMFRQRQNESVIGISSVDPAHMMVAYNDYRTIDFADDAVNGTPSPVQGLLAKALNFFRRPWSREREREGVWEADDVAGANAWMGLSFTDNGGKSWNSGLHPGRYVPIPSPTDMDINLQDAFQLNSFDAASDPVMATTQDQFFLAGIAFNAPPNGQSIGFFSRFTDRNNSETRQNIHFDGTKVLLKSSDFVTPTSLKFFVDKPSIAAAPGAPGGKAYVYAAFVVFDQTDPQKLSSKILFFRSADSGEHWLGPLTVSQPLTRNQSPWIVIDPNNPLVVYIGWRVFANPLFPTLTNAVVGRKSTNGGASFTPSVPYPVALLLKAFDQPQGNLVAAPPTVPSPRSAAYPTAAIDGSGAIHVLIQEYVYPATYPIAAFRGLPLAPNALPSTGVPRITVTTSNNGGVTWTLRKAIDLGNGAGTQFMPVVAAVGEPGDPCPGKTGPRSRVVAMFYDARAGGVGVGPGGTGIVAGGDKQFDVRIAQASACSANPLTGLTFSPSQQVSQYSRSSRPPFDIVPIKNQPSGSPQYAAVNRPYTMNCLGDCTFTGDYIHLISRVPYVKTSDGRWKLTTATLAQADRDKLPAPVLQGVWADARDVWLPSTGGRSVPVGASAIDALHWDLYNPPGSGLPSCVNPGSRDLNVYTAEYTPGGLFASAPVTFKTATIPRSYPLYIENRTAQTRFYKVTIDPLANASFDFRSFDTSVNSQVPLAQQTRITIGSISSVTGTVVVGPLVQTPIAITIEETNSNGAVIAPPTGAKTTVTLNTAGADASSTETYVPAIDPTPIVTKPFLNRGDPNGLIPTGGLVLPAGTPLPNPTPLTPTPLTPTGLPVPLTPTTGPNSLSANPLTPTPLTPTTFTADVTVQDVTDISYVVTNEGEQTAAFAAAAAASNQQLANHVVLVLINRAVPKPGLEFDPEHPTNCNAIDTPQAVPISTILTPLTPTPLTPTVPTNPLTPTPLTPTGPPPETSNSTFYVAPKTTPQTARMTSPVAGQRLARATGGARIRPVAQVTTAGPANFVADRPRDVVVVTIRDVLIGAGTPLRPADVNFTVKAQVPNHDGTNFAPAVAASGNAIPDHLAFTVQPATTSPGATITPAVQVAIQDVFGNTVTSSVLPVTIALGNSPATATLSGALTKNAVNGIATFDDLKIDRPGAGYTLRATSGALKSATSVAFNIITEPLTILTLALPEGTQGEPYSQTVFAKGGLPPYTWDVKTITTEFVLPDGLQLTTQTNGSGLIAGTPSALQVRSFRLRVTDSVGQEATQDLCIHIDPTTSGSLSATPIPGTNAATIAQTAQTLVGEGVSISNASYVGVARALGTFSGGFTATGLSTGIILSSGAVANINPTNSSTGITADNQAAGDADLSALIPASQLCSPEQTKTCDAAVLEFDFVVTNPAAAVVKFDYVFASDEYSEFANTQFNDVFGFFLSGPDFPKANLALIPGTNPPIPVSINNINNGNPFGDTTAHHPELFIDNPPGAQGTQADGLTKVMSMQAAITPLQTYHLKIAIADAGDHALDSWVLLKAGSLAAVCPIIPK